jgi:hypothetical protein
VIEEKINCTLIFPQFVPTPSWFPVVLRCAHIVTVVFLGDRGVLLFPSWKGYQVDKRGLQFNIEGKSFIYICDPWLPMKIDLYSETNTLTPLLRI